jgi:hypothetical protein
MSVRLASAPAGAKRMSWVIKMSTPKHKQVSLPKTAALTKAQAEHRAWLKARGIKVTKNTLRTRRPVSRGATAGIMPVAFSMIIWTSATDHQTVAEGHFGDRHYCICLDSRNGNE